MVVTTRLANNSCHDWKPTLTVGNGKQTSVSCVLLTHPSTLTSSLVVDFVVPLLPLMLLTDRQGFVALKYMCYCVKEAEEKGISSRVPQTNKPINIKEPHAVHAAA